MDHTFLQNNTMPAIPS